MRQARLEEAINTVDGFVEKFTRMRDELGITSIMVGDVKELAPVVERLAGTWAPSTAGILQGMNWRSSWPRSQLRLRVIL